MDEQERETLESQQVLDEELVKELKNKDRTDADSKKNKDEDKVEDRDGEEDDEDEEEDGEYDEDDEDEDEEEPKEKKTIKIPKFLIPPALPKIEASGSDSPKEVRGIDMITGVPESEKEETSDEMMADAMGIPPGEGGMQEAFEDVTGMPADGTDAEEQDAMDDITGMSEGELNKITGMDSEGKAWRQITGDDKRPTTKSRVVSKRIPRKISRIYHPTIGRTK